MKQTKRSVFRKVLCTLLCVLLFIPAIAAETVHAAGTPIPVCVKLNSFSTSNVGDDSASTLLWKRGDAYTTGGVMRLADNTYGVGKAGTVVRRSRITLSGGFSTYFVMNFNNKTSSQPADGLTFIIQNNAEPDIGDYGGGVGYENLTGTSFGVEFDTWYNEDHNDPNANHVAIVQNGVNNHSNSLASTYDSSPGFNLYGSGDIHVWVDYAGDGTLTVHYGQTDVYSSAKAISKNVGTSLIGKEVYVGFAASTGGSNENHDVKKWYFMDSYQAGGLQTAEDAYEQGASSIRIVPSSTANPSYANITVLDAAGATMTNQSAAVYVDNVYKSSVSTGLTGTATYEISGLSVGTHTLKVVSASGGATDSVSFTVTDTTPPSVPTVSFAGGYTPGSWTNSSVSFSLSGSSDTESAISYYQYSTDGGSSWTAGSSGTLSSEGTYSIKGRAVNSVGLVSLVSEAQAVNIDKTAPAVSFAINNGDIYSKSQAVDLAISGSDVGGSSLAWMEISNASGFTGSTRVAYAGSYSGWSLQSGDGAKTVYFRVQDSAGNYSNIASDSIIYDSTKPSVSISVPSTYSATKGTVVEYIVTYSDGNGISDISLGNSDIALSALGAVDTSKLSVAVKNVEGQAYKRLVEITVGNDMTGEGTVGVHINAGTAADNAGNISEAANCDFSFNVDLTPPANQDQIFTSDLVVKGGTPVTLAHTSKEAGGLASDSVRFAPGDYIESTPSNGATVTSTHGESKYINAPTEDGTYYVYVVDAAGNMSEKSIHKLIVKNSGPSIGITGPSKTCVQASSSVTYTVTYTGAVSISLEQSDVALVTTGTANAYISVSEVSGNAGQRLVTLSNLMGEGTVRIKLAAGTAADEINNLSPASSVSDAVTVDNTPAVLSSVILVSDNDNNAYAKKSDKLVLDFVTNEEVQGTTVTIAGQAVTAVNYSGDGRTWHGEYTIPADGTLDEENGKSVQISIITTDIAGNVSVAVTGVTSGSGVTLDFTAPVITLNGEEFGEGIYSGEITVEFNEGNGILSRADAGVIDTDFESGSIVSEEGTYSLTVTDAAGNSTTETFFYTQDCVNVREDKEDLVIIYSDGDTSESVTRKLTLETTGKKGSIITWESSDEDIVSNTGKVTRPLSDSEQVILTATITKGDYNETKIFTVTVKAQPDTGTDLGKAQEDVESAYIEYSGDDSASSVTLPVYLSAAGRYWDTDITWFSSDASIRIDETVSESVYGMYGTEVTRPLFTEGDKVLTLTATAQYGSEASDREFILKVKRQEGTEREKAEEDAATVSVVYASGDDSDSVTKNITLVSDIRNGSSITWQSSNTGYLSETGKVTRPALGHGDKTVTLTAEIRNGSETITKSFSMTILENTTGNQQTLDIEKDMEELEIGYAAGDNAASVTANIFLPAEGTRGSSVAWSSDNEAVVDEEGYVNRGATDIVVHMTAVLNKNGESTEKIFELTVKAKTGTLLEQLQEDADKIEIIYGDGDSAESVTKTVTLPLTGANGSTVAWSSSLPSVIGIDGSVDRQDSDTAVTLTARLAKGGFYTEKTFELLVKKAEVIDLDNDKAALEIVYGAGDSASSVTRALYLTKTGASGSTVTWTSSRTDLITSNGRVTRPGPDTSDRYVVLTALITDPKTGNTRTKTFTVLVKMLSNAEATQEAAKNLTVGKAFSFAVGDNWESITSSFLMLTAGDYDTSIQWESGNSSVISIGDVDEDSSKCKTAVSRAEEESRVILTATITRNGYSVTKTFLLIVKGASVTKEEDETRVDSGRTVNAAAGTDDETISLLRTTLSNGETVDTVILDPDTMLALTENINPAEENEGGRTVRVTLNQDPDEYADEEAIEIPANSVSAMAERNSGLVIESHTAALSIDSATLHEMENSGIDLYFRMSPLDSDDEIKGMKAVIASNDSVKSAAGSKSVAPLGVPVEVETNYSGFTTYLTIPFNGMTIPETETEAFLSSLRVFIEHSDGDTEVVSGTIVYNNGEPYGIRIAVDRFSSFQIMQFYTARSSKGGGGSSSGNSTGSTSGTNTGTNGDIKISVDSAVNGETSDTYGKTTVSGAETGKTIEIALDDEKVQDYLEGAGASTALDITAGGDNMGRIDISLSGDTLGKLADKDGCVNINSGSIIAVIEAADIDPALIKTQFGNIEEKEIKIVISLQKTGPGEEAAARDAVSKSGGSIIGTPLKLTITAAAGDKQVKLSPFRSLVKLSILLPEGQDTNRITTAVRVNEDKTITHVPTKVTVIEGRYYATVHCIEDGTFAVIWNPLEFADMKESWAREEADDMGSRLVVEGTGNNCFTPGKNITRAEFAAITVRALGLRSTEGSRSFNDVSKEDWYYDAVRTASLYNIVKGFEDGSFRPDQRITREEAMTMVARAMKLAELDTVAAAGDAEALLADFTDGAEVSGWAKQAAASCISEKITSGRGNRLLVPKENITRAETAAMLRRMLKAAGLI